MATVMSLLFNRRTFSWKYIVFGVLILSLSVIQGAFTQGTDMLWGVRNGGDIVQSGQVQVFIKDVWNLQTLGELWSPNSWLWNVVLYGSYNLLGTASFFWVIVLTNIMVYTSVVLFLRKINIPTIWQFVILGAVWAVLHVYLNGRSNTADIVLLLLFLLTGFYLKDINRFAYKLSSFVLAGFSVSILWINMHLTGVLAIALLPFITYVAIKDVPVVRRWVSVIAVGAACTIGVACSPFGITALLKVSLVQNESENFIEEWSGIFFNGTLNLSVALAIAAAVVVGFFAVRTKQFVYTLTVVAFVVLSATTIRMSIYLVIILLAGLVFVPQWWTDKWKALSAAVAGTAITAFLFASVLTYRVSTDVESILPVRPSSLGNIPQDARVLSTIEAGSTLILYRPDVLVALDGRNDLIGKERVQTTYDLMYEPDVEVLQGWLEENAIDTVFVPVNDTDDFSAVVNNMRTLGWQEYEEKNSITFTSKEK
jgi:hypothetical protein